MSDKSDKCRINYCCTFLKKMVKLITVIINNLMIVREIQQVIICLRWLIESCFYSMDKKE